MSSSKGEKTARWGKNDCQVIEKAILNGVISMDMSGAVALDVLQTSSDPILRSIAERYKPKQMTNRLKSIKEGNVTVEELHAKTVNKMTLDNDLHSKYGE
jgi:hypothetical protein